VGGTGTQKGLKLRDWQFWNRFGPRGLPPRVFPLKWECAKKDFLAHFRRIGFGSGFSAALLVGGPRYHPHRLCELVGGLSQRLVLNRCTTTRVSSGSFRFSFVKKEEKSYGMTSRSPSLTAVACSWPREL
jgi:hypothetical protein